MLVEHFDAVATGSGRIQALWRLDGSLSCTAGSSKREVRLQCPGRCCKTRHLRN
jgi:hypothetical protein